uniref:Putative ovule protein n=1 Tax=Solanum chacoense TaxID=4108 RepID=A0A0V0H598_SOLCH
MFLVVCLRMNALSGKWNAELEGKYLATYILAVGLFLSFWLKNKCLKHFYTSPNTTEVLKSYFGLKAT